ncbi:Carboxypeptidase T precursor [compost metagenome]
MHPKSTTLFKRAGAATLAAGMLLAAVSGCATNVAPPAREAGPRDLGPVTAAAFNGARPATVSVAYKSKNQLAAAASAGMEIWYVDQDAKKAFGSISADQLSALKAAGLEPRLAQAPGPLRNDFDAGYHTYDQIKGELTAMAAGHPEIAKLSDIGDSWEKTQGKNDRDILMLRIGKGDGSKKPAVIFCGNHHAREIVTPEIVLRIARMLLDGYGKDADITHFVENRDILLVPMVNPDGHKLATEGSDWRKNTNLTTGGGSNFQNAPNGPGVDLNRNYGYKWGGPGAAANPTHATFRGPAAFSEPETQAIKKLVESRKFTFLMSYHSFSNLILWPWGHTDAPPPDKRLAPIGMQLGKLSGYKPQQSVNLYPTSGDTTDWAFGEHGILSYTSEIGAWGDGFDPPYSKMGQFWKENEPGARLLLTLADNPDHVFGPTVAAAETTRGAVDVTLPKGAVEAEAFIGKPGADGTGMVSRADGNGRISFKIPSDAGGRLMLVHAKDAKGNWGPLKAVFTK